MTIIQIHDIEILFNTIQDLYNYQLTRADKDKILEEITQRAPNPRKSKIINLTVGQRLIILTNEISNLIKTLEMTVQEDFHTPLIPIVITFKLYKL